MTLPRSYVTAFADHRRASRVDVVPGVYRNLVPLVAADRPQLPPGPLSVLVDPHGPRWVLGYAEHCLVVGGAGTHSLSSGDGRWIAAFDEDGVRFGNRVWSSFGAGYYELCPFDLFDVSSRQIAARRHDDLWITVGIYTAPFRQTVTNIAVRANGALADDEVAPRWRQSQDGEGAAAITDDDRVGLLTLDRRLRVFRHPRDPEAREPDLVVERTMDHDVYSISAIDEGFVVVGAVESSPAPLELRRARLMGSRRYPGSSAWQTQVRSIDPLGETKWSAHVRFPVSQPPIDMGGGRVAVVGRGLACIENGRVLWEWPADVDVYATSYVDGTLAVGVGPRLMFVGRDGFSHTSLDVPGGIAIVTPPAIGADRSVTVGTTGQTFVAVHHPQAHRSD